MSEMAGVLLVEFDAKKSLYDLSPQLAEFAKRIENKRRFRHATSYSRDHPLLVSLVSAVGKTPAKVNTAWLAAKILK